MNHLTAMTIMRLGAFTVGCAATIAALHYGWTYGAGWLLVPTIIAGLMCVSLGLYEAKIK